MAYLERLQQGLLGAMQAQNNPSAYLAQRQQQRAADNQAVQQQYAQATQQGQASMAQLSNEQRQMEQAGQQAIAQHNAQEEAKKQKLMQLGLTFALGGLGGGGAEAGAGEAAAESAGNAVAEEMGEAVADTFTDDLISKGAISDTAAMSANLEKFGNLANASPYKAALRPQNMPMKFF